MANEFLKTGGRDREGLARGLKTNKEGNLTTVDAYTVLQNEVTYQADGKLVDIKNPRMCGPFDVQGMDQLFVSLVGNGAHTWELWIHEIILSNDRTTERVINSFRANNRVYSSNQTFTVPINSALIKVELREITIPNMPARLSALYLAARKNPQPYKTTKALNQNYLSINEKAVLMDEVNYDSQGQWVAVGASRKTPLFDVRAYDHIQFYLNGNGVHTWELWVNEIVRNENGTNHRVVKSFRVGDKTHRSNQILEFDISSPFIELEFKEITSADGGRLVAFYIVGSKKGSEETALQQLVNTLNTRPSVQKELPNKPELKNIHLVKGTGDQILWYANGLFYANDRSNRNRVLTSPDAETWTLLHEFSVPISKILVGDTGYIMAGGVFGEVFISDENGVFSSTPNFVTGKLSHMFGRFKHENILGFSTYHSPAGMGDGQLHEAFLSTDNGKTYNKVFDNEKLATLLKSGGTYTDPRVHLHDFEYDPYSGRLYIWQGDFDSVTFYYSDDWGASWNIGFPRGVADNHSQIIANKEGITFGADNPTGGVGFLKLNRNSTMPEVDIANFDKNHWNFKISEGENYVAAGKFIDRKNDLYLLAFEVEHDKNSVRSGVLAYSRDGIDWQILFRSPIKGGHTGFETVFYGNNKLVALYKDNSSPLIYNTLIADMEIK